MTPCPHCGARVGLSLGESLDRPPVRVLCQSCGASGPEKPRAWAAVLAWSTPPRQRRPSVSRRASTKAEDFYDLLVGIADDLAPELQDSFLSLVSDLRDSVSIADLIAALKTGDLTVLDNAIGWSTFQSDLGEAAGATLVDVAQQVIGQVASQIAEKFGQTLDPEALTARAVTYAEGHAGELATNLTDESRQALRDVVTQGLADGRDRDEIASSLKEVIGLNTQQAATLDSYIQEIQDATKPNGDPYSADEIQNLIDGEYQDMLDYRADMIAQTEVWDATNQAQLEGWREAADEGMPIDGLEANFIDGYGDEIDAPPYHPRCLPGFQSIEVLAPIDAVTERVYNGALISLVTAEGHELACTPNHPVLTPCGWRPAHDLSEGDEILYGVVRHRPRLAGRDHHYGPAMIKEVAKATRQALKMTPHEVKVASEDFHGDGEHSDVAVVWANRLLRGEGEAATHQSPDDLLLVDRPDFSSALSPARESYRLLFSELHSAHGVVGGDTSGGLGGRVLPSGSGILGGAWPARFYTRSKQCLADDQAGYAALLGEGEFARSVTVSLDHVASIRQDYFSGHVYNLQTASGWYLANGIITHNCYCYVVLKRQIDEETGEVYYVREWNVSAKDPCEDCLYLDGQLAEE